MKNEANLTTCNKQMDNLYLTAEELNRLDNIPMSKQIQIMEHLSSSFALTTISEYCRINNVSRQSIYDKKKDEELPCIEIGGVSFMFGKF
jgi:hypothetical protein